jgi:glycine/D-amino acid oxidase-like deaminating enzyme
VVAGWLIEKAARYGATLIQGAGASELREGTVRLTDGSEVAAGVIVNAAGMAAARLMPELPLHPKKGHLAITDRYPGFAHHQVIELGYLKSAHGDAKESVAFNVQPRPAGQLLIGSSRQIDVEDAAVDPAMLARMLRRAVEYMPGLAKLSTLRAWTGFRAATPDNLPLIGPYPGGKGLYAAAGHEGLGITTALGTARLLADCVLGRESGIPPEPYWPERFSKEAGRD